MVLIMSHALYIHYSATEQYAVSVIFLCPVSYSDMYIIVFRTYFVKSLNAFPSVIGMFLSYKFWESQYRKKLYEQKTESMQPDGFLFNS
jgi:hypothetical protein